ncbi:MAG: hypothetical protein R8N50_01135 [Alphaproteobacteria bacterium]|nr:hypothetical protein [Alphaproteobacteria bacterium]
MKKIVIFFVQGDGVVGGTVGNSLVNGKPSEMIKDKKIKQQKQLIHARVKRKNALDVLDTSNGSSFTSSLSNILGG